MYLPAEGVYYELVCGKTGALLQYAHDKRVFPVSPTTLYVQLQVIALGLKGLQIEQHAHEVMAYVAQLAEGLRPLQGGLRPRRHTPRPGAVEVRRGREAPRPVRGKLERAAEHEQVAEPVSPAQLPIAVDAA